MISRRNNIKNPQLGTFLRDIWSHLFKKISLQKGAGDFRNKTKYQFLDYISNKQMKMIFWGQMANLNMERILDFIKLFIFQVLLRKSHFLICMMKFNQMEGLDG